MNAGKEKIISIMKMLDESEVICQIISKYVKAKNIEDERNALSYLCCDFILENVNTVHMHTHILHIDISINIYASIYMYSYI